ncbi:MAG: NifB/NifX family molybdenum-iron cluster-binding protein [Caldisphaeraceae archaeon]|nr:NifB/NifX family molybdenum-iron cluster-binding protein [Caldisphaeraceae archaeon]
MSTTRIAIPTEKGGLDDLVYDRLGRAPTFTVVEVDLETGEIKSVEVVKNPGAEAGSGAGAKVAQAIADAKASVYVGPSPGPNAYAALQYLGVKVFTVVGVKVKDAIKDVIKELKS